MRNSASNKVKHFSKHELLSFFGALEKERKKNFKNTNAYRSAVRDEAFFKLLYYCGLRVSELCNMPLNYYDEERNELYCERYKGGKDNTLLIIDKKFQDILKLHLEVNQPQQYIFEGRTPGMPMSRKSIYIYMKDYCEKAGITNLEKCHPHTLRHTRAVDMLDMGCSIYDVQFWLGHVDISNTMIYLRFTTNQQTRLYNILSGIELSKKDYQNYSTTQVNKRIRAV